jgi:GT2 family glycosyltransferase
VNPALVLTHNSLSLTQKCVESLRNQDIPTETLIWDNASTDGTGDWLRSIIQNGDGDAKYENVYAHFSDSNRGVSEGWNWGLNYFFNRGAEHVLVCNNDTFLPSWFYSSLLAYDVSFVTGVSVGSMDAICAPEPRKELAPCPDFSAYLITKECWEKVGKFDDSMVSYCGDLDFHIRAHRAGVRLWNSGVNFYHERSSTLNSAPTREKRTFQMQADADRMRLQEKWGCTAWGATYAAMFDEKLFGIDARKEEQNV